MEALEEANEKLKNEVHKLKEQMTQILQALHSLGMKHQRGPL